MIAHTRIDLKIGELERVHIYPLFEFWPLMAAMKAESPGTVFPFHYLLCLCFIVSTPISASSKLLRYKTTLFSLFSSSIIMNEHIRIICVHINITSVGDTITWRILYEQELQIDLDME